ncbi:MAG: hypothetical protein U0Y82_15480 [Thermoleophilia bacterium]
MHRVPSGSRMVMSAALVALLSMASQAPAALTGGAAPAGARPPEVAGPMSGLCTADTAAFRIWWTETPGAPGALPTGGDGVCATVPPQVQDVAATAAAARASAVAMGFPGRWWATRTRCPAQPVTILRLLRTGPAARAGAAPHEPAGARRYLAGVPARTRRRVMAGLPRALTRRLARDVRAAVRGVPSDFMGGNRRVDVVLDGSRGSGWLQGQLVGYTRCHRDNGRFVNAQTVVLASDPTVNRAVLAHELFHVVQCDLTGLVQAKLLLEGTADWFAALTQPQAFSPAPAPSSTGGQSVVFGTSRTAEFCSRFLPVGAEYAPTTLGRVARA